MIRFDLRQGIGFDIEYNETTCYNTETEEGPKIIAFEGIAIKIPFVSIEIGNFYELLDWHHKEV